MAGGAAREGRGPLPRHRRERLRVPRRCSSARATSCWLDRARRFAAHAIAQVERARAEHGMGRYSLWTGDLGIALYLADCVDGRRAAAASVAAARTPERERGDTGDDRQPSAPAASIAGFHVTSPSLIT